MPSVQWELSLLLVQLGQFRSIGSQFLSVATAMNSCSFFHVKNPIIMGRGRRVGSYYFLDCWSVNAVVLLSNVVPFLSFLVCFVLLIPRKKE